MIEILILHQLKEKVLTMYGISKEINASFSVLTTPSFGTIKPALVRLEKNGYIKTQKNITEGGRPSIYYSITNSGKDRLQELILGNLPANPIQFLPSARIKIACAEILSTKEQIELFKKIKLKAETIALDIKNMQNDSDLDFYKKMVLENLTCEYKNFVLLLEGLERASKN